MIYEQILTYFADDELILTGKKKKKKLQHWRMSTWYTFYLEKIHLAELQCKPVLTSMLPTRWET